MEKYWVYDDEPTDNYELKIRKFLKTALKNEEIASKSARTLGLFKFLNDQKFESPEQIYDSVFLDKAKKEHFFTKSNSKKIYSFLSVKGGDMSEAKPYDKLVWRWFEFVYWVTPTQIQEVISFAEPFAFPLHTIETDFPGIGEIVGFSIDMASEMNKIIAKNLQQYTPIIFGFVPIPEASTIGLVLGYMFSTFFIFFNMAIFVGRKELGQAFTQSFALIPFVGMGVQNAAESGDRVLEKFSAKRGKFIEQIRAVLPGLADFLNMILFDPNYSGDSKADAEYWKGKIGEQVSSIKGSLTDLRSKIGDKESRQALVSQAKDSISPYLQQAQEKAKEVYDTAKTKIDEKTSETIALKKGGKRFSKIGNKKSKWKTQRKSKI
jgi:hypothetical protein